MNVELPPELEKLVNDEIENGDYQSANEVVREGLRLVRLRRQRLAALRQEIQNGIDAIERGEYREYTSVEDLFDDVETAVAERKAQKTKKR